MKRLLLIWQHFPETKYQYEYFECKDSSEEYIGGICRYGENEYRFSIKGAGGYTSDKFYTLEEAQNSFRREMIANGYILTPEKFGLLK